MSIEAVRRFFAERGMEERIMEFAVSSATVDLAALALGVAPARIAKTLALKDKGGDCLLVVAAGDAKLDNAKFKAAFGMKAAMLPADEALSLVGHAVGGVCPFAVRAGVPVYLDVSMERFETVFPACGSASSAIELTPGELFEHSGAKSWVDVCKDWQ